MKEIKILHNTTTIGKSSFGIGQISVSLAQAQLALKNDVSIWCLDNKENIQWASQAHNFPVENVTGFKLSGPRFLWYSPEIKKYAHNCAPDLYDVVHQHGIWTGASSASLILSKEKNLPVVIAPHGSLNKWVLNLSNWKKKIALAAFENENLKLASCLHATSENEISDFRNFGLINPIAYIQNGIQAKYLSVNGKAERFHEEYNVGHNKRILFFLSRISPKKGLLMLINAINTIREQFAGWQLIIAGIDEFNHKKEVELLIKQLSLEDSIKIIGPLFDQSKNDAFAASELFILPSHSEGSPMVVLDSLASGVPVITTKASSWSDLIKYNCGWWTDINTTSIAVALKKAVVMNAEELKQLGENGKLLISDKYSWAELAKKTLSLYNWLLKREEKPDFITLN